MRYRVATTLIIAMTFPSGPALAQGVNYHQAQQAGKVWGDKISENNRRNAAKGERGTGRTSWVTKGVFASFHRCTCESTINMVGLLPGLGVCADVSARALRSASAGCR